MGKHTEESRRRYRKERKRRNKIKKRDFRKNYFCNTSLLEQATDSESTGPSSCQESIEVESKAKPPTKYLCEHNHRSNSESTVKNPFDSCTLNSEDSKRSLTVQKPKQRQKSLDEIYNTDPLYIRFQEFKLLSRRLSEISRKPF